MQQLARALRKSKNVVYIDTPWQGMNALGARRGNLGLVLGSPGIGKSAFALNWALGTSQPAVIISLDTDLTTQASRAAAILSNREMKVIEKDPELWAQYLEINSAPLRLYDLPIRTSDITDILRAEEEYWGQMPGLCVVDNVSNLIRSGGFEEYKQVFIELHRVARLTECFVLALHHVKRGYSDQMLDLSAGQYGGEGEAEIVLGLWSNTPNMLNVSMLKNRSGPADNTGKLFVPLLFDKARMRVTDMDPQSHLLSVLAQMGPQFAQTNGGGS